MHWCLVVSFHEDANGVASGHAGTNLGLVRRVALSLVKHAPGNTAAKSFRPVNFFMAASLNDAIPGTVIGVFPARRVNP